MVLFFLRIYILCGNRLNRLSCFSDVGKISLETFFSLNENASEILTGILLFFILGCEFFINYRLEFRKHNKEGVKA